MIFKVDNVNNNKFIVPIQNENVFLISVNENPNDKHSIGVYNYFHQLIGYVSPVNKSSKKILNLLLSKKPIICKIILSNIRHKYILVDATQLDFKRTQMFDSNKQYEFSMN